MASNLSSFAPPVRITDGKSSTALGTPTNPLSVELAAGPPIDIGKVDQGTPNTNANAWPVKVTDGTSVLGTGANPIRIDPTGTTIQPISGTVAATQGTTPWVIDDGDKVDTNNSSTAVLGSGAVFTGIATDVTGYSQVGVIVFADQNSANNGFQLQFSTDATNWDYVNNENVIANQTFFIAIGVRAHYCRVVYTNGTVAQTVFRLQTILKPSWSNGIIQGIDLPPLSTDDVLLTKSVISGKTTAGGGSYVDVKVNPSGAIAVDASNSTGLTGTFTANQGGSWTTTVTQSTGTNLHTVVDSGTIAATQSGTWTTGRTWNLGSGSDSVSAVQSGSWTVTANAGTNLNTSALALDATLTSGAQKTKIVDSGGVNVATVSSTGAVKVDGSAVTQPVSGTVTANQGGAPWSQNVTQVGGTALALGQTTMASSVPVAIASNQSAIPVTMASNVLNAANSTTTPLTAGSSFTGISVDTTASPIGSINVLAISDQNSVVSGLQLQFSTDNVNWDHNNSLTLIANQSASLSISPQARYFRVHYTNGSVNQGSFRLQTFVSIFPNTATVKDLNTQVSVDDNAAICRSVLTGKATAAATIYTDVLTDVYGTLQVGFNGAAADAFGRARVSEPTSLFNAQFQYDTNPLIFQTSLLGTGSVTKTANETSITLSTGGTASGAQAINQTKNYIRYQPGKSQQILMTGVLGVQKTNVRSRIGYFDVNDGVYVEQDGTLGPSINQRSSTSGSPVTTQVTQANWNFDKFDGTGPSGITIDFSKTQIFMFDLQWLGVGRVRVGFYVNGLAFIAHIFNNANLITSPYMNSANLPCRAEITNTGVAASTTTMKQICVAVSSEGGTSFPSVLHFAAANGITSVNVTTRAPVLSIRPKTTFNSFTNRSEIQVETVEVINGGGTSIFWELVYNGTLTGASFVDVDATNSAVQKDVSASAISGGIVVASGYVGGSSKFSETVPLNTVLPFTLDLAGTTADIYSLCATSFGAAAATNAAFNWSENK